MSQIFDGLQRLEGERLGVDGSSLAGVAELLQHAERRAVSKWEKGALSDYPEETHGVNSNRLTEQSSVATEAPPSTEPSLANERSNLFGKLQTLPISLSPETRLPCITDIGSPAAEAFRLLGVRLRNLRRDRPLKKVLITSTIPQEGKSMVAANLACTLAQKAQQKILVLDGDLRRPSLSKMFGIGTNPGLSEWLEADKDLATSVYHLEDRNIWILPAGSAPNNALELIQSKKLSTLMDQLETLFDWIIIDSPPVLPLADTSVWMRLADGIFLITRQGVTEKRQLQRGLDAIESKKLIGALMNSSNTASSSDYYYYGPATVVQSNAATTR
jgi:capsular exopolysaccharide synthesis family protein